METLVVHSEETIRSKVREYVVENFLFGDSSRLLQDAESFIRTGVLDSTGILELIEYVELKFGIKVEENETIPENLDSLASVTAFIHRKIAAALHNT